MANARHDLDRYKQGAAAGTVTRQTLDTQSALVEQRTEGRAEQKQADVAFGRARAPLDEDFLSSADAIAGNVLDRQHQRIALGAEAGGRRRIAERSAANGDVDLAASFRIQQFG